MYIYEYIWNSRFAKGGNNWRLEVANVWKFWEYIKEKNFFPDGAVWEQIIYFKSRPHFNPCHAE